MIRFKRAKAPPTISIRAAALGFLTRRDYTTAELRDKLATRLYPDGKIDETIAALTAQGLLDDRRVAAAHLRTAGGVKGRGRLRIVRELEARGVARSLVREIVAEWPAADEAQALAKLLYRKRIPKSLDPAARRRLFRQLLRRGFPADAIAKAIGGIERDEDD
jgi:regulatory protein